MQDGVGDDEIFFGNFLKPDIVNTFLLIPMQYTGETFATR